MISINKVTLLGNTTKDPELKYTPSGLAVVKFSIATNKVWFDKQTQEKKQSVEFHNVIFWRKSAEIISQYVHKGDKIYIEGHLTTREYEKDGMKRWITEIVGDEFVLLGTGKDKTRSVGVDTDSAGNQIEDIVIPDDLPEQIEKVTNSAGEEMPF